MIIKKKYMKYPNKNYTKLYKYLRFLRMKCFNNANNNKNQTIYQQFSLLCSKGHFKTINDKISFITEKLIYSGLEDITTIDKKWNDYNNINHNDNECYDITKYLEFIISLIKKHNDNNDSFDSVMTFSEI